MIGSGIGATFDTIQGRKVGEMSSPRAQEGEPIPLVFGTARVTGRLMSCGEPSVVEEGGKGGPQVVNETAYLSYSILVCESSELRDSTIGGILMVIQNNKIVYDVRPNPAISAADSAKWKQNKVFYFGGEGQGVDPTEQMIHGAGNVPAYRGLCRMVVTDEDVTQHGGSIPTYEFVTSQCGVADAGLQYERVEWDRATETYPNAGDVVDVIIEGSAYAIQFQGALNRPTADVTADTFVSAGDWYWETTTGWVLNSFSDINHFGWSGIIRQSDGATAGVLRQSGSDGVASGDLMGSSVLLYPGWVPTVAEDPRTALIRNRLSFDEDGLATWSVAINDGDWQQILSAEGSFAPFAISRGTYLDPNVSAKRVFLYSVPDDFLYGVPDGAIALGAAKAGYAGHTGTEIPDSPGYYIDPDTGEISGPTATVDTCPPITLQEIIDKLDARAGIPVANSVTDELADIEVPGYAIDQFVTVAEAKEPLRQVWFFDCPEWDDAIRYRLRGQATDFTIDPDDLIEGEDATEQGTRGQTVEYPKRLHVQYVDPVTGYKPMKQTAERISPDIRVKGELVAGANITLSADTAKQAADIGLKAAWTEREDSREFAIPVDYWPQAIAAHTFTLDGRRYRITELRLEAGAIYIKSVYDRISAYQSNAVGTVGPSPTPPPSNVRGPTISMVMNAPVLRDADDKAGIYWAGCGPMEGWQGARLQVSRDGGATWENGPLITAPAVMGELTATLPAASRYAQDNTNTLAVTMYRDEASMDSTDFAGLMEERNVWAIQYPSGKVEIGQFETAIEIAARQWELTGLMRGRQDTVAGEHLAGAKFVLLNDAVRFVAIRPDDVGKTLKFRAVSIGTDPDAAEVQTITFTTIESLREWQPYNVEVAADGLGGYCVAWIGRARLGSSRAPAHSQWFEGYRVTFTIGSTVHEVNTTAQSLCVSAETMLEAFGPGHGIPTITVRARSRVATNDDDFDSPPGVPADPETNFPVTIVGGPSDGYVGEPIFDPLGPTYGAPFQAYGGAYEEYFMGEIVANVIPQSSGSGQGIVVGVPLTAETRNAAAEIFASGPLVVGGPFLITDSVTIAAKPTFGMMDESLLLGGSPLITPVTTPVRVAKQVPAGGQGGIASRAGFSSGFHWMEIELTGVGTGDIAIGVHAGTANSRRGLSFGIAGHFAYLVGGDGTYMVTCNAATGAVEVFKLGAGSVATGTLPLTHSYDGKYRFAWSVFNPAPGAVMRCNQGNETPAISPPVGCTGVPNVAMIVPCGFDATVAVTNGSRLRGELSLTEAFMVPTADVTNYAYPAFGKSTGKWRVGIAGFTTSRSGFCKAGHTGPLGANGAADSIGFTDTRSPVGYVIETSFGGAFNRITLPQLAYYTLALVRFAFDVDAGTVAIYVASEVTGTYELLVTLTGVPAGTWLPALSGGGQLRPEIDGPATYTNWTLTV